MRIKVFTLHGASDGSNFLLAFLSSGSVERRDGFFGCNFTFGLEVELFVVDHTIAV